MTFKSRELFRPGKGVFTAGTATKHGRSEFSVTTLTNGRVMSVGGNAYLNGEFPVLETQKRWLPYEPFAAPVSN